MVGDSFMEMAHVSTAKWRSLTTGSMAECCYSLWSATGEGFLACMLAPPFSLHRRWLPLRKEVEAGLAAGA